MKRYLVFCILSIILVIAANCFAQDKFDPAARAKLIAPFIEEQTAAVVHIDFTRVKIEPVLEIMAQLLPDEKDHIADAKEAYNRIIGSFLKAGGKDIYVIVQASATSLPKIVIPVGPQADQDAIMKCEMFKDVALSRGGAFLVGRAGPGKDAKVEISVSDERSELAKAFETAGDTAAQAILLPPKYYRRVIEETMPQLPKEIGGGPSTVVTNGCLWAALSADFSPQLTTRLVMQSQDASAAEALKKQLVEAMQNVAQLPQVKAVIPKLEETAGVFIPKVEGNQLVLSLDSKQKEIWDLLNSTITLTLGEARDRARRMQSVNNFKQIGLAMHNYLDANKHFPAAAIYSKDGKPLLSWRVMILPMMEHSDLYEQFRLDEPWDSEHNKKLIDKMPNIFKLPTSKLQTPGMTNYVVPVGPGTVFQSKEGMRLQDIKDGTAHTVMEVEVDDDHAVIWTKPEELSYDPKEPAKGLGVFDNSITVLFCDGSVRKIKMPQPDDKLRAVFSASGREAGPHFD
jgi:hypothetical protein